MEEKSNTAPAKTPAPIWDSCSAPPQPEDSARTAARNATNGMLDTYRRICARNINCRKLPREIAMGDAYLDNEKNVIAAQLYVWDHPETQRAHIHPLDELLGYWFDRVEVWEYERQIALND